MSINKVQNPTPVDSWEAEDEIDLRKYIDTLIKRWREIVFLTVVVVMLTAAGLLFLSFIQTPLYQADASVAIVRTQTEVNFDDRFTTSSGQQGATDVGSRRSALLGLVYSGSIAERVIADLGDQLSEGDRDPATLLQQIEAQLGSGGGRTTPSDLIVISARADSPQTAAAIANAWAQNYVQEVNRIYGQVPDEMIASVQSELDQARIVYEESQRTLEQFLTTSPLTALQRELQETQGAIDALQRANSSALSSYVEEILRSYRRIVTTYLDAQTDAQVIGFEREQEGQRQLLNAYMSAYNNAIVDSFDTQRQRDARLLRLYYDQWLRTAAAMSAASTLQAGLTDGGEGAVSSTMAALQLLKLQLVSSLSSDIPTMQHSSVDFGAGSSTITLNSPFTSSLADQPIQSVQTIQQPSPAADNSLRQPLFQIALTTPEGTTFESLNSDLNGVIQSLDTQMVQLESKIVALNEALLSGEHFENLNAAIPDQSALVDAIRQQYPAIFESGLFSEISESAGRASSLGRDGQAQAAELLKLAGAETVLLSSQPDAPMAESIVELENRLQILQSRLEAESSVSQQITEQRNLAWDTYRALSTKRAELRLERAAANSEVRMGTLAIAPNKPAEGANLLVSVLLAGVVGLLLAVFLAFLLEYMGKPPLFTRTSQAT